MATGLAYHTKQTHYLVKEFSYTDTGTITIGKVPANSIVINAGVVVATAFDSGTSNTLDIGTDGDSNGFATLLDLTTAGVIQADELATSNDVYASAEDTLVAVHTATGTAASAGSGYIFVEFLRLDN